MGSLTSGRDIATSARLPRARCPIHIKNPGTPAAALDGSPSRCCSYGKRSMAGNSSGN
ncbi:hypothetical protein BJX65DRAFT_195505 [Aspergillus insuetus]